MIDVRGRTPENQCSENLEVTRSVLQGVSVPKAVTTLSIQTFEGLMFQWLPITWSDPIATAGNHQSLSLETL